MKTEVIKLDLTKKLQPFLKDFDCECFYYKNPNWDFTVAVMETDWFWEWDYKTLSTIEAIEFIWNNNICYTTFYIPLKKDYECNYIIRDIRTHKDGKVWDVFLIWTEEEKLDLPVQFCWKTLHEAIEKMLEWLLYNLILWK